MAHLHGKQLAVLNPFVHHSKTRTAGPKEPLRYTQNLWIDVGVRSAAYPPGC